MPGWSRKRRVGVTLLALLLAVPVSGWVYQWWNVRRETGRFAMPGRLIPVAGGRRLHLLCLGQGSPTILFEASSFGGALSSSVARLELSKYARVCSYDRMGMGWSDPGPAVISAGVLVNDLESLIAGAGLSPPFLLVPSSIGGITVELFARRHPNDVAGMVFLDAGNSLFAQRVAREFRPWQLNSACLAPTAARFGLLRFLDPLGLRRQQSAAAAQSAAQLYRVEAMNTLCGMARGFTATQREFAEAPALPPGIQSIVLVHEKPDALFPPSWNAYAKSIDPEWRDLQRRFAEETLHSSWRVVPGSDHLIGNSQPHAVVEAVLEVLARLRG